MDEPTPLELYREEFFRAMEASESLPPVALDSVRWD